MRNKIKLLLASCLVAFFAGNVGQTAELVMFESGSCDWCEAWHEEIGVIYGNTEEAHIAPLRRVDIEGPVPEDLSDIRGIRYTPTFVLMQDGREVGRIMGYPGEDFFWGLLNVELAKLRPEDRDCVEPPNGEVSNEKTDEGIVDC